MSIVVVVGKVIDVEKDTVEVSQYRGAPKDRRVTYKVAVVKIEEPLVGGRGLTQYRVGFPADFLSNDTPRVSVSPVLAVGQEACFFLSRHFEGDFYVLSYGTSIDKKDKSYAKELEEIKKVAKILDDPIAALKAKELDDRFQAAYVLLERYRLNLSGKPANREPTVKMT